ncbi:MAG: response regulator transcription factor [Actinomycetota bacterium]
MTRTGARVLVVDDEREIRKLLKVALSAHGFDVIEAKTGREGLEMAATQRPDITILDLGLPDISGLEVLRSIREWSDAPIIILSVRGIERDKITALDSGADDYVTKPFSMGELLARINVSLRHMAARADEPTLDIGDLHLDLAARTVSFAGDPVKLTPTEYDVLKLLAINAGKVLTHRQLLREIWGIEDPHDNQYLRVYIRQIRKKVEPDPSRPIYILTEPGVGYRLAAMMD